MTDVAPMRDAEACCGLTRFDQLAIVVVCVACVLATHVMQVDESNADDVVIDSRIDLNHATAAEFDLLDGIGPKLSQRIIEDREARGPFKSVANLQRVKGIGPKTLAKNREHVRVEPTEL